MIRGDASQIYHLASDLSQVGHKSVTTVRGVMQEVGDAHAQEWADGIRARGSGGTKSHIKHLPDAITAELGFGFGAVSVEVGPESSSRQGFMGPIIEHGGTRSPAYLDGLRALDVVVPRAERMLDAAVGHLFG